MDKLSIMSHDIKSSITSAKAYVQLVKRRLISTNDEKSIEYILKMDQQMDKMTQQVTEAFDILRKERQLKE